MANTPSAAPQAKPKFVQRFSAAAAIVKHAKPPAVIAATIGNGKRPDRTSVIVSTQLIAHAQHHATATGPGPNRAHPTANNTAHPTDAATSTTTHELHGP
ncbi:hypothetical protein [Prauserella endophytica]|uniref:hypothetical protein n=1 Tax=Prauserella endophytica TaxID=1592324 RepID=UPI001E38C050|nr:hypothetical protein [Prauserella endophytica]